MMEPALGRCAPAAARLGPLKKLTKRESAAVLGCICATLTAPTQELPAWYSTAEAPRASTCSSRGGGSRHKEWRVMWRD
mgnify:CR=1 FL=1